MEQGVPVDASSLIYLAKADAFEELVPAVGRLAASPGVWFEAVEEGERIGAAEVPRIHRATELGLVERVSLTKPEQKNAKQLAQEGLGRGESEVIAMGGQTQTVVIDEGRGSRVARARGLKAISTLQLVLLANHQTRVDGKRAVQLARELARAMNVTAGALATIERRLEQ